MKNKTTATARAKVTVVLEVDVSGPWGDDCTVGQVQRQASKEATDYLNRLFNYRGDIRILSTKSECLIFPGVD